MTTAPYTSLAYRMRWTSTHAYYHTGLVNFTARTGGAPVTPVRMPIQNRWWHLLLRFVATFPLGQSLKLGVFVSVVVVRSLHYHAANTYRAVTAYSPIDVDQSTDAIGPRDDHEGHQGIPNTKIHMPV